VILWGDPIYAGKGDTAEDLEAKRLELEEKLSALTDKADEMACGR
jgi:hypothetical protein